MHAQSSTRAEHAIAVEVFAPARLHLGFLDPSGSMERRFGGLGLTLEEIGTCLVLSENAVAEVTGPSADRARRYLDSLTRTIGAPGPLRLTIHEAIPEHIGLGSGTQLGLAVAAGLAALMGQPRRARALSPLVNRGGRSGIGIGSFDSGGFLVDGGRGKDDMPPPIVARADFPAAWRLLLIFDAAHRGLSGEAEKSAFAALPPFPSTAVADLCRIVLIRLLPGLAEEDFTEVSSSVGEIQSRVGDHFSPAQGGRYASPRVGTVLEWLRLAGFSGIGQSSWGPTGFVLVDSERRATALIDTLTRRFPDASLSFRVCTARNRGADIRVRSY
jgi:beta-ribofuranosylaminobenzene 5'-phosphate synthase